MGENRKRKLDTLTLKDNFMFGAVMTDPENCRPFLEMALGISIGKLTVSIEKSLVYHPEYKGVRLDVEASDENHTRFNVEMQVIPKPALEHRARYYHSQIDMELLRRGGGYGSLPDAYVIFICDFDPFDRGRYRYTFRNMCLEEREFALQDGLTTMFLSTHGTNQDEVPEGLVGFLKYIGLSLQESTKDSEDGYVRQLQAAVRRVKASREWEARFMILEEMLQEQRESGYNEGEAKGIAKGITKGIVRGITNSILDLLADLPGEVSEELREFLSSEQDADVLRRYLKLAASASSVEEFMRQLPR